MLASAALLALGAGAGAGAGAATARAPSDVLWTWDDEAPPSCAMGCASVVTGPMTANGDVGVVLGGTTIGKTASATAAPNAALTISFGKNDFWGWPGMLLWHGSFEHFHPGDITLSVAMPVTNSSFSGRQAIANATIAAAVKADGGYELRLDNAFVAANQNTLVANVSIQCPESHPAGVKVALNLTLGPGNNMYNLTVRAGVDAAGRAAWLTKPNANHHELAPLLVPCTADQLVYNALRTTSVGADNAFAMSNGTDARALCLELGADNSSAISVRCPKVPAAPTLWRLTSAGHVEHVASGACLVAKYTNSTQCPAQQLDPASAPICRSELWKIEVARRCADAPPALSLWKRNAETGHLELPKAGRCLAAVPPLVSNGVAIVATIQTTETNAGPATAADPLPPQPSETATLHPMLECGIPALLTVGVASERDAGVPGVPAALSLARHLSMVSMAGTSRLRMATTAWWSEWWQASRVELGPRWSVLQDWYYTMMYLLRGSSVDGKVAPALWGPWSVSEDPDWGDEMTLDYNFEANVWAASTSNHPELIESYTATIMSLMPLSRARASSEWSKGGWPDMFGAEVAGMSCGPTVDWDHDYGCPEGFGHFDGIEMMSATGPFEGMEMFFDDGCRFVAGLAATPMVQYYETTVDRAYLEVKLLPVLRGIADFYTSYAICSGGAACYLPHTCAQEICAGGKLDVINSHQDLSYATMAYTKLLAYAPSNDPDRVIWTKMLAGLPSINEFPKVDDENVTLWADAAYLSNRTGRGPYGTNAAYGISHIAAIFPAQLVGTLRSTPEVIKVARATVTAINDAVHWVGSGGFDMEWPQAARVATPATSPALLERFVANIEASNHRNGYTQTGGGGLEMIGGADGVHALLLQSHEGAIRVFPAWPQGVDSVASFTQLRATGAFLVSASWNGTSVDSPVTVVSEAGGDCVVENPFAPEPLCIVHTGSRAMVTTVPETGEWVNPTAAPLVRFPTTANVVYTLRPCPRQ